MRPPSLERRPATTAVVRGYLRASKAAWLFCIGPPETPCRSGANAATRRRTCYAALSQSIPTSDRWRFPLLELSPGYSWQPGLFRSCGSLTLAMFALRRKTSDPLRSDRADQGSHAGGPRPHGAEAAILAGPRNREEAGSPRRPPIKGTRRRNSEYRPNHSPLSDIDRNPPRLGATEQVWEDFRKQLKQTSELGDRRCPMLSLPLRCDGGCDYGEDGCQRRDRGSIDQCAYHCLEPCWMGIWLGVNNPVGMVKKSFRTSQCVTLNASRNHGPA